MAIPSLVSAKEVRRYALIVGVNQAPVESHMQALQYADDDAARHFELFEHVAVKTALLTVLDGETQQFVFPDWPSEPVNPPERHSLLPW